jgi:hypothetical protein
VGPGPRVIDWVVVSCGGNDRLRRLALQVRAAVCSFCTRSAAHRLYDLWTQAPVSGTRLPWSLDRRETDLARRETDLIKRETDLIFREEMLTRRGEMLAEHELEAEEKEKKLEERIRQFQMVEAVPGPQAMEATRKALEDL